VNSGLRDALLTVCNGGDLGDRVGGRAPDRGESAVLDPGHDAVLTWRRRQPRGGGFIGVVSLSPQAQDVDADTVTGYGTDRPVLTSDGPPVVAGGRLTLPGLGYAWFAEP
jgi:amylosucrase